MTRKILFKHKLVKTHDHFVGDKSSAKETINFTLIQPSRGRFTLTYLSLDYLHTMPTGLPSWIRVNYIEANLNLNHLIYTMIG